MARINDGILKDWQNGQTMTEADYELEREIIRTAINDNYDKLSERYTQTEVDNLLSVLKGDGWTNETLMSLKAQIQSTALGQIPDGSITQTKLAFTVPSKDTDLDVVDTNNYFTSTKLNGVLDELFTFANNGKTSIANVVGSPTVSSDTFTKVANDIQANKYTLATNLTNKGQSSTGSETLASLVAKVANVSTGKKFASGTVTSSAANLSFTYGGAATTIAMKYVTVAGLTFKPSLIEIYTGVERSVYSENKYSPGLNTVDLYQVATTNNQSYNYNINGNTGNAYVNGTGFQLPVINTTGGITYNWRAYE